MINRSKTSPFKKREIFVTVALVMLLSLSLSFYYFVYTPQQLSFYNKGSFRVLEEIVENFKIRLVEYSKKESIKKENKENTVEKAAGGEGFPARLTPSIIGSPSKKVNLDTIKILPWLNTLLQNEKRDSAQSLTEIFEPIIAIHRSTFESVILIRVDSGAKGKLLYNSHLAIDEDINVDTLYKKKNLFNSSIILDITIESVDYKLFLYPYRIDGVPFVMGGLINNRDYKDNAKTFPVFPLLVLTIIILIIVMSLPFLKIFYIGQQESIKVTDIRSIIGMTYILPFFVTLLGFTIWFNYFINVKSTKVLSQLHRDISTGFYNELDSCIVQLKYFDSIIKLPEGAAIKRYNSIIKPDSASSKNANPANEKYLADVYLHPAWYKNMDAVFWIGGNGDEIAKWDLRQEQPTFFHKKDRQYFTDIKNNAGYTLPGNHTKDSFSLEPTLSKTDGDYTISISTHSQANIGGKQAEVIGLSAKMYAVFKPVLPKGSDFCIINTNGDILYHSQSERNLQENIFREISDSNALRLAVSHKDSILIDNMKLYDKQVKMVVSPLNGLPYFMVSYIDKRPDLLYIFHITGFSILCEGLILLVVALLTLYFSYSTRRSSMLFFSHHQLDFIKPSILKKNYYKKIFDYLLYILLIVVITMLFLRDTQQMFFVLNISMLLPFFSVIGYYLIRYIENNELIIPNTAKSAKQRIRWMISLFEHRAFRNNIINILVPYTIIIILYHLVKTEVLNPEQIQSKWVVNLILVILELCLPLFAIIISVFQLPSIAGFFSRKGFAAKNAYLSYFVSSIILSATVTSVVPTIGFILNAAGQEKRLQLRAQQLSLAEAVQQHREYIDKKVSVTKLAIGKTDSIHRRDHSYIDSLKFSASKGLYLLNNHLSTERNWGDTNRPVRKDSSFYKMVTRFLFLPPDHTDFFDNIKDYYYWDESSLYTRADTIRLHYKNTIDHEDPSNLVISTSLTRLFSPSRFFKYDMSILLVIGSVLFVIILYRMLIAVSKRIFLLGYFELSPGKEQDTNYLNNNFFKEIVITDEFEMSFWNSYNITPNLIAVKENEWPDGSRQKEEGVIKIVSLLAVPYEKIWQSLNAREQFALYDFAVDGFTNYKNADVWYSLYKQGLVIKVHHHFKILNDSFRNFIVSKAGSREIVILKRDISESGTWGNLKTVFYALLLLGIIFLFIVQEDVSKRVFAIVTSLGALVPFIIKLFDSGSSSVSNNPDKK